ncbi:MAG TPA: hypothetical protein PLY35_09490 [Thermotogota bacterium]|nr:hypothetical protein [Thermotogota bacterium]
MFKCEICNSDFKTEIGLQRHLKRTHGITLEQQYINKYLNGIHPTCACGCGEYTKFHGQYGFSKYKQGHIARIKNNWGHNQKAIDKSAEVRREKFKSKEITVWNAGLKGEEFLKHYENEDGTNKLLENAKNADRNKRISDKLTGRKHTKEHIEKHKKSVKKYWDVEDNKIAARMRMTEWMKKNQRKHKTNLEYMFETILIDLNLNYIYQYDVDGYNYDFYLTDYGIIIEVDGDWYHCNPEFYSPISEIQIHTIEHDNIKNKVALNNNIPLLRFWEYDIKNNLSEVINKLKTSLKIK